MNATMLYVHAISPIHVGMGQGAGIIDLPVIRETSTSFPFLPGSSLKGVIRDASDRVLDAGDVTRIFGPKRVGSSEDASAGSASFTDARLLFLPVRTYKGSFAWVTSPLVLARWSRDRSLTGVPVDVSSFRVDADRILLSKDAQDHIAAQGAKGDQVVQMEDLNLIVQAADSTWGVTVDDIASTVFPEDATWQTFFKNHTGVVTDTAFAYLATTATEVVARNRIDDHKKTVVDGALWWEEAVPAESIFAGMVIAAPKAEGGVTDIVASLTSAVSEVLQIGGDATIGRGLAQIRLTGGGE